MSLKLKLQDMPPSGGYGPINYKRVPAKTYFSGLATFGIYIGVTSVGLALFSYNYFIRKREEIEMRSARMAITPLLVAENDREYLKQLIRNRDAERDLMKNVEGWTVGKLNDEPIYRTLPEDFVITDPLDSEIYAHTSRANWWKRMRINFMY